LDDVPVAFDELVGLALNLHHAEKSGLGVVAPRAELDQRLAGVDSTPRG
jgi:hypothetical protein